MNKDQTIWNIVFTIAYAIAVIISANILYRRGEFPISIPALDLIIISLAIFRLIRLFVYDSVTQYVRDYFERFDAGPGRTIADLLSCPWCTGVWMALIVLFFYVYSPFSWYPITLFALAGIGSSFQVIMTRVGRS